MVLPHYLINHCQHQSDAHVPATRCQDWPGVANYRVFWKSNKKHLRTSRGRRAALAGSQCPHAPGALLSLWQAQVPRDPWAPDWARGLRDWAVPHPISVLQVLKRSPLMPACAPTAVPTPAFNTLSQRHIQSPLRSAQAPIPGWLRACPSDSPLPPFLAPAQMQLCIYSP